MKGKLLMASAEFDSVRVILSFASSRKLSMVPSHHF